MENILLIAFTNHDNCNMLICGTYLSVTYFIRTSYRIWVETIIHYWLIISFISTLEDFASKEHVGVNIIKL